MASTTDLGQRLFYPLFVVLRAALLFWLCARYGASAPPIMLPFLVLSFLILIAAERWIPHRRDWQITGDRQVRNDLGHSVAYVIFGNRLGEIIFVWSAIALFASSQTQLWAGVWPSQWPFAVQVALVIFLGDGLEYAFHRLSHGVAWLWPLHVLHHTPDRVHALKTLRHHWLYAVLRGFFILLPLLLVGAPLGLLLWVPLGLAVVGSISHANVQLTMPAFMYRVLNTPDLHRIHHSMDPAHQNANYCFVFPIWDILFRSFVPPETTRVERTGVENDPVPDGFLRQLALPLTLRQPARDSSAAAQSTAKI